MDELNEWEKLLDKISATKGLSEEQEQTLRAKFLDSESIVRNDKLLGLFNIGQDALTKRLGVLYEKFAIIGNLKGKDKKLQKILQLLYEPEKLVSEEDNQPNHSQSNMIERLGKISNIPFPDPSPYSELLTPENMLPMISHNVFITVNLAHSAGTEDMFCYLKQGYSEFFKDEWIKPIIGIVETAFNEKNQKRKELGVNEETTLTPLVRLISDPIVEQNTLILEVAPIGWDLYTITRPYLMEDKGYQPDRSLLNSIEEYKGKFRLFPVEQKFINRRNFVPLGIEALVITKDKRAFLRCKDRSSTEGGGKFDVSFSGYARLDEDGWVVKTDRGIEIKLDRWAKQEFYRETGVRASLEESSILGVHRNMAAGSIDIMACFHVDCYAEQIVRKIYIDPQLAWERAHAHLLPEEHWEDRRQELLDLFNRDWEVPRSHGAREVDVFETSNHFVPIDKIKEFIDAPTRIGLVLPEARQVIIQALKMISLQSN